MYLTTIRLKRAQARTLAAVLTEEQTKAIPRDEQRRVDALSVHVAGVTVAIVTPGRAAQSPTVVWRHEEVLMPDADLLRLVKASIVLMDQAAAVLGESIDEGTPPPPARLPRRRGTRRAVA